MHVPIAWLLIVSQSMGVPAAKGGEEFSSPCSAGDEVRLMALTESPPFVLGRVATQDEAGLTISRAADGALVTVPWTAIRDLEIARVRHSRRIAVGAAAGLVVGVALAATCKDEPPEPEPPSLGFNFGFAFDLDLCPYLVPRMIVLSTVAGGLIGSLFRKERVEWERAYHPRLELAVTPTRGRGAALALTMSF